MAKKAHRVDVTSPVTSSVRGYYFRMTGQVVTEGHERPAIVMITDVADAKSIMKNLAKWVEDSEREATEAPVADPLLDMLEEKPQYPMTAGPNPIPVHELLNAESAWEILPTGSMFE